jgi:hypothetical protein
VFNVLGKVYPRVLAVLIDRESGPREAWFCEGADRYDNATSSNFHSVMNGSTAGWAKVEHGLAAVVSVRTYDFDSPLIATASLLKRA